MESTPSPLNAWESFYVIVGSSAAALTGLQFVVITLIAESRERRQQAASGAISAFGTPTVVHFCAALLVSAILSAPWPSLSSADVVLVASGVAGIAYVLIVNRRAHQQTGYRPVFEDWLWHVALPFVAYLNLLAAALVLQRYVRTALFMVGATALLLLFIGIHNAWDTVTYLVLSRPETGPEGERADVPEGAEGAAGAAPQGTSRR
jgi:hypothetical protein